MNAETQVRLDRIVGMVLASPTGECCRNCIVKEVRRRARRKWLNLTEWDVKARIRAQWEPVDGVTFDDVDPGDVSDRRCPAGEHRLGAEPFWCVMCHEYAETLHGGCNV